MAIVINGKTISDDTPTVQFFKEHMKDNRVSKLIEGIGELPPKIKELEKRIEELENALKIKDE